MSRLLQRLMLGVLGLVTVSLAQADVTIHDVRMWPAPDHTRLVFDLTAPIEHSLFTLDDPQRVVVDIKRTQLQAALPDVSAEQSLIKRIRYAHRGGDKLRVVLDLHKQVKPKSFVLKPHKQYGHRLVIDLQDQARGSSSPRRQPGDPRGRPREVIVAIDAGHGGEDPGAVGPRGTREKDVVLKVAQRLHDLLEKEPGMKPVMIRTGDYFLGLRERVDKAREAQADLFVSIHADAFRDHRAHGSSVYVLSERGASSEVARFLAESENNSDLVGGVSLNDKDDLLRMVLVDMVKNSTMEHSHQVAARMLQGLKGVNRLHKRQVEQAGFRVLKAPDIPSVLVETAFISNPQEERKLRSARHQAALARALLQGIRGYFINNAPPGTVLAEADRRHRISRGETLSEIAERYRVSVNTLKQLNKLSSDLVRVGQVLRIPAYGRTSDS